MTTIRKLAHFVNELTEAELDTLGDALSILREHRPDAAELFRETPTVKEALSREAYGGYGEKYPGGYIDILYISPNTFDDAEALACLIHHELTHKRQCLAGRVAGSQQKEVEAGLAEIELYKELRPHGKTSAADRVRSLNMMLGAYYVGNFEKLVRRMYEFWPEEG